MIYLVLGLHSDCRSITLVCHSVISYLRHWTDIPHRYRRVNATPPRWHAAPRLSEYQGLPSHSVSLDCLSCNTGMLVTISTSSSS